ncbi:MAG: XdhC family protein [Candidatus Lambdaproteobacteria bacterium]|nr:XdhC family protein [Candidatus Lambdaproteobacteria bacterium]
MDTLDALAERLANREQAFVMALVVRCEAPTSAKPGARALITPDGSISGWIGGGCAQPIVLEEAQRALREGTPRLVRITPHKGTAEVDGLVTYEMVCHSGGTMDIFVEPVLPLPQVLILGRSPVARALAQLARTLKYRVHVFSPHAREQDFPGVDGRHRDWDLGRVERARQSFIVVSTQGEDDEGAMLAAARAQPHYLGFVASTKKWQAVSAYLAQQGLPPTMLEQVQAPAGMMQKAVEPEEIALSVLAEIVQRRRAIPGAAAASAPLASPPRTALDPVCHMTVDPATARYVSEHNGQKVYFCCSGCQQKFEQDPERFLRQG